MTPSFRSLGMRTEVIVMAGEARFEDRGSHIVKRTPAQPEFWYGNQVIWPRPTTDLTAPLAAFDAAFPDAAHCVVSFDVPDWRPDKSLLPQGFELETSDVLSLTGAIRPTRVPGGIVLRQIESETDWAQVLELQVDTGVAEGFDRGRHRPYLTRQFERRRAQYATGLGAWFGAFDGDLLVSDMGIVHDTALARYQSVETRESHRRRGLCGALLVHARNWVAARAPGALPVIVAEADSAAGRLYRRAGFSRAETIASLLRPAY